MPAESTAVREVLLAFSRKQANPDAVMRALTRHDGWLVPVGWLASRGIQVAESLFVLSTECRLPAGALWAFTDRAAAQRAQAKGALLGAFAQGWAGADLFASLDQPGVEQLFVNPADPQEEGWWIPRKTFPLARLWADATRAEQALEGLVDAGVGFLEDPLTERERLACLRSYAAWVIPIQKGTNNILGMPTEGGGRNGLLFSTPDACDAWLARCSPEVRAMVARGSGPGAALFAEYRRQGFDFVFVNPIGPSRPVVLELDSLVRALSMLG